MINYHDDSDDSSSDHSSCGKRSYIPDSPEERNFYQKENFMEKSKSQVS